MADVVLPPSARLTEFDGSSDKGKPGHLMKLIQWAEGQRNLAMLRDIFSRKILYMPNRQKSKSTPAACKCKEPVLPQSVSAASNRTIRRPAGRARVTTLISISCIMMPMAKERSSCCGKSLPRKTITPRAQRKIMQMSLELVSSKAQNNELWLGHRNSGSNTKEELAAGLKDNAVVQCAPVG